jgi:hypothetical protein
MLKIVSFLCCLAVCSNASASYCDIAFINHTAFSYTADASGLHHIELFQLNKETRQMEAIHKVEIAPGIEEGFTLQYENHGEIKNDAGEFIDYGKIILQKSGEDYRHMTDIIFAPLSSNSRCVSPSLSGANKIREFIDPQNEFAITVLRRPKVRKWGSHFVFSVEKFEEGKESYTDFDQIFLSYEDLMERERRQNKGDDVGCCCGMWRKQRKNLRDFNAAEQGTIAADLRQYGLSSKFISEYTGLPLEVVNSKFYANESE